MVLADDYADVLGLLSSNRRMSAFVSEELNLLYVALTRARSTLVLSASLFEVALIDRGLHHSVHSTLATRWMSKLTHPMFQILSHIRLLHMHAVQLSLKVIYSVLDAVSAPATLSPRASHSKERTISLP